MSRAAAPRWAAHDADVSPAHRAARPPQPQAGGVWAGLDGCRAGWALAVLRGPALVPAGDASPWPRSDGWGLRLEVHAAVATALTAALDAGATAVGVDMPIGTARDGRRSADAAARARLGPRRASLFPTPARGVLEATDWADALRTSRRDTGKGLSRQAWNLVPKIVELDRWVGPEHDALLYEVHPELAFGRLAGAPLAEPKRSPEGLRRREALLAGALGDAFAVGLATARARGAVRGAALDDLLDATAVACSARALDAGCGTTLGDGERDERGLPMRICF